MRTQVWLERAATFENGSDFPGLLEEGLSLSDLSISAFAKIAGTSGQTVNSWLRGMRLPSKPVQLGVITILVRLLSAKV